MTGYQSALARVLAATSILSSTEFSWFGRVVGQLPRGVRAGMSDVTRRRFLVFNLTGCLYENFYCTGGATPHSVVPKAPSTGDAAFEVALSRSNVGRGLWEPGWSVVAVEDDIAIVEKNRLTVRAPISACRADHAVLEVGATVDLLQPKELLRCSPGYYLAFGDAHLSPEVPTVRLYWNLRPEGAASFVHALSKVCNRGRFPAQFKVVSSPQQFDRCDAAVLYLPRAEFAQARPELQALQRELAPFLDEATPSLTKHLSAGLGLAESPGSESFGMQRCRLLAEAMFASCEATSGSAPSLESLVSALAASGVDIARPYLEPGSADDYDFDSARATPQPARPRVAVGDGSAPAWLPVAYDIAQRLVADAVVYRRQANWVGATLIPPEFGDAPPIEVQQALRSSLYEGTSGIALFLAEMAARSDDAGIREIARAAIRHALATALDDPPAWGFYSGAAGVAATAISIASILAEEEWAVRGRRLFTRIMREEWHAESDLLSGIAGGLLALLVLHAATPDQAVVERAMAIADELVRRADRTDGGVSWPTAPRVRRPNLTGLSHGASGVALALMELAHVTGEQAYRETARRAFAYEASWFEPAAGNWADLRETKTARPRSETLGYPTLWCHGAPGIALARVRADELFGSGEWTQEGRVALLTTLTAVEGQIARGGSNYSLCHGIAGNAGVLVEGHRLLGEDAHLALQAAERTGTYGVRAFGGSGAWPGGAGAGSNPSLMLGLAGAGWFYLRLADQGVPSVLLPRPAELARSGERSGRRGEPVERGVAAV